MPISHIFLFCPCSAGREGKEGLPPAISREPERAKRGRAFLSQLPCVRVCFDNSPLSKTRVCNANYACSLHSERESTFLHVVCISLDGSALVSARMQAPLWLGRACINTPPQPPCFEALCEGCAFCACSPSEHNFLLSKRPFCTFSGHPSTNFKMPAEELGDTNAFHPEKLETHGIKLEGWPCTRVVPMGQACIDFAWALCFRVGL